MFTLQYEEAPTSDAFTDTFSIVSHSAYALVDTSATLSYMSEEFRNACGLSAEAILNLNMCINTPLGSGSSATKTVKSVDVFIERFHVC